MTGLLFSVTLPSPWKYPTNKTRKKKTLPCNVRIQIAAIVSKQNNLLKKNKHADTMPVAS